MSIPANQVRNDPRDSELMRKWWAFKESALDCLTEFFCNLENYFYFYLGAAEFQSRARSLKRKYWWRNMKMWMILGKSLVIANLSN